MVERHYGDGRAQRSGLFLMQQIDEGLHVLHRWLHGSDRAQRRVSPSAGAGRRGPFLADLESHPGYHDPDQFVLSPLAEAQRAPPRGQLQKWDPDDGVSHGERLARYALHANGWMPSSALTLRSCYGREVLDSLTRSDIELSRATSPAEKLEQALELMRMGIRLKLAALRAQAPHASQAEIKARLEQWLQQP